MKRLFKLLVLAAITYGIVWMVRERMVPEPVAPSADAPRFRTHEPSPSGVEPIAQSAPVPVVPPEIPSASDDLQAVKGIGPVYARKLAELDITGFAGLLAADSALIVDKLDVSQTQVDDWKTQAAALDT